MVDTKAPKKHPHITAKWKKQQVGVMAQASIPSTCFHLYRPLNSRCLSVCLFVPVNLPKVCIVLIAQEISLVILDTSLVVCGFLFGPKVERERAEEIDRDNLTLLKKMQRIMQTQGSVDHRNTYQHHHR